VTREVDGDEDSRQHDPDERQREPEVDDPTEQDCRLKEDAVQRVPNECREAVGARTGMPVVAADLNGGVLEAEPIEDEQVMTVAVTQGEKRVTDAVRDDAEAPIGAVDVQFEEAVRDPEVGSSREPPKRAFVPSAALPEDDVVALERGSVEERDLLRRIL